MPGRRRRENLGVQTQIDVSTKEFAERFLGPRGKVPTNENQGSEPQPREKITCNTKHNEKVQWRDRSSSNLLNFFGGGSTGHLDMVEEAAEHLASCIFHTSPVRETGPQYNVGVLGGGEHTIISSL